MDELFQHFLNAIILGGTYALLGIGLTLIFGIMRVVNFTHGELYAFGAYCMYALVMLLHVNFFLALILAVMLGILMGAALEMLLLNRLRGADIDTTMLVMIGAWIPPEARRWRPTTKPSSAAANVSITLPVA